MKLSSQSHLFGETILKNHFSDEYEELRQLLATSEVPLRPAGPFTEGRGKPPKRQWRKVKGGRRRILLPADMPTLNVKWDQALRKTGWDRQPYVANDVFAVAQDKSRGDFEKNRVFVEVEFGNTASLFRDVFKFQVANRERVGDVAVLITATRRLMKFHDSGVATFEKMQSMLPYLALTVQMPIWIVGVEPDAWDPIRTCYGEMRNVASPHEPCLSFEEAFGEDLPVEDEVDTETP